jgi:hypothetical protein
MRPMPSLGVWIALAIATALAVCAFIGATYLLHWVVT